MCAPYGGVLALRVSAALMLLIGHPRLSCRVETIRSCTQGFGGSIEISFVGGEALVIRSS